VDEWFGDLAPIDVLGSREFRLPGHTSVILERVVRVAGQTLPIHMLRFGTSFLPIRGCVRRELVEDPC
jgi:hypothetical protein